MRLAAQHRVTCGLLIACGVFLALGDAVAQTPTFTDETEDRGFTNDSLDDVNAAWSDLDHDGWPDLIANHQRWKNVNGTGGREFDLLLPNLSNDGSGYDMFGDFNLDGFPDLVSWAGVTSLSMRLFSNNDGDTTFDDVSSLLPTLPTRTDHSLAAAWGDFDKDGDLDLYVGAHANAQHHAEPDVMLKNSGYPNFSFSLVWEEPDEGSLKLRQGRAVVACDFDEDDDLDVFVANYWEDKNYLWLNNSTPSQWSFAEVADDRLLNELDETEPIEYERHGYTIGAAWGDFDNDGHFDLLEANLKHPMVLTKPTKFFKNNGPTPAPPKEAWHFEDVTAGSGLTYVETLASPALADYDNDGDLDFFLTVTGDSDHSDEAVLYSNNGNGSFAFTNVTTAAGLDLPDEDDSVQAAWADFDRDGDLDLVTNKTFFVNKLNNGSLVHPNRWIELDLVGKSLTQPVGGRGPIVGAQVRIAAPGVYGTVTRQVEAGTGQGNQSDTRLHFGLGASDGPLTVEVTWPNGDNCTVDDLGARQICAITHSTSTACTTTCALDSDGDGIYDSADNCPGDANPEQENGDADTHGDACDNCPDDANENQDDFDDDAFGDVCDNCPTDYNPAQDIFGDPTVTVVAPNGGETVRVGVPTNLTWTAVDTCGGVASVDLRVYRDGLGGSYSTIATGIPNSGTYSWTPPGPITNGFTAFLEVIARDPANFEGSDTSDSGFKIGCNVCVADFCREIGERCTSTGCTTAGCCGYSCTFDPTCTEVQECPPNSCIGCF